MKSPFSNTIPFNHHHHHHSYYGESNSGHYNPQGSQSFVTPNSYYRRQEYNNGINGNVIVNGGRLIDHVRGGPFPQSPLQGLNRLLMQYF